MLEINSERLRRIGQRYSKMLVRGDVSPLFNAMKLSAEIISRRTELAAEPLHLQIELTEKCNLNCPMCCHIKSGAVKEDLAFELFAATVESFASLRSFDLTGMGPCSMNPRIKGRPGSHKGFKAHTGGNICMLTKI